MRAPDLKRKARTRHPQTALNYDQVPDEMCLSMDAASAEETNIDTEINRIQMKEKLNSDWVKNCLNLFDETQKVHPPWDILYYNASFYE